MDQWVVVNLSASEQEVWKAVAELRTEDVHTRPVETEQKQSSAIAMRGGKILVSNGKICCTKVVKFQVRFDDAEYDAHRLANESIVLLRRFVKDFPALV
jgi:hypothetical protein